MAHTPYQQYEPHPRLENSILDKAMPALRDMGAKDASTGDVIMSMLYKTNPKVRQIVDKYKGRSIDDLLRERGVDPDEARKRLGL